MSRGKVKMVSVEAQLAGASVSHRCLLLIYVIVINSSMISVIIIINIVISNVMCIIMNTKHAKIR